MGIKIVKSDFEALKSLLEKDYIPKKDLASKELLKRLLECDAVKIEKIPKAIICISDEDALYGVLNNNGLKINKIEDLDYHIEKSDKPLSRMEIVENYSHSKESESKSFNGLMVSVLSKLEITLNGQKQYIYPMEGTGLFLHYTSLLELDSDTIVVGVENPQVVWYIEQFSHLFSIDKKYLFLSTSEYKTSYQYHWLESLENQYIHFGDFDLAGISIYLNSIVPRLKNCISHSFLIPKDIYKRIKNRNYQKDYSNQTRYKNLEVKDNEELEELIEFIKKNKITLEQEMLTS